MRARIEFTFHATATSEALMQQQAKLAFQPGCRATSETHEHLVGALPKVTNRFILQKCREELTIPVQAWHRRTSPMSRCMELLKQITRSFGSGCVHPNGRGDSVASRIRQTCKYRFECAWSGGLFCLSVLCSCSGVLLQCERLLEVAGAVLVDSL